MAYARRWSKKKGNKYVTLDKWFSRFVRLRDTDVFGQGTCITCGGRFPFHKLDAGHYQSRVKLSTRWDPQNVHGQCHKCNRFNGGEKMAHGREIKDRYGQQVKDMIDIKSNTPYKPTAEEIKRMRDYYRKQVHKLFKGKEPAFQSYHDNLLK